MDNEYENQDQQRQNATQDIQQGVDRTRQARNIYQNSRKIKERYDNLKDLKRIKGIIDKAQKIAKIPGAPIIIIIVIIAIATYMTVMNGKAMNFDLPTEENTANPTANGTTQAPIPGLTIEKTGDAAVQNGEEIHYVIAVTYEGDLDVVVYDQIPENAQYRDATGSHSDPTTDPKLISWNLKDNSPDTISPRTFNFKVTLSPTQQDTFVKNVAYATSSQPVNTAPPPNINASDFDSLMTEQGRNTGILGDIDTFVNTVTQNGGRRFPTSNPANYASNLRRIYEKALARNVNPLAVLTIWGVESSFTLEGTEFGCKPFGSGFEAQLSCSVNTLDYWMNDFISKKNKGIFPVPYNGSSCLYSDPFPYAYEAYTPVCSYADQNDAARTNFMIIYKEFLGAKK